jgi:hypothetical protein
MEDGCVMDSFKTFSFTFQNTTEPSVFSSAAKKLKN